MSPLFCLTSEVIQKQKGCKWVFLMKWFALFPTTHALSALAFHPSHFVLQWQNICSVTRNRLAAGYSDWCANSLIKTIKSQPDRAPAKHGRVKGVPGSIPAKHRVSLSPFVVACFKNKRGSEHTRGEPGQSKRGGRDTRNGQKVGTV